MTATRSCCWVPVPPETPSTPTCSPSSTARLRCKELRADTRRRRYRAADQATPIRHRLRLTTRLTDDQPRRHSGDGLNPPARRHQAGAGEEHEKTLHWRRLAMR